MLSFYDKIMYSQDKISDILSIESFYKNQLCNETIGLIDLFNYKQSDVMKYTLKKIGKKDYYVKQCLLLKDNYDDFCEIYKSTNIRQNKEFNLTIPAKNENYKTIDYKGIYKTYNFGVFKKQNYFKHENFSILNNWIKNDNVDLLISNNIKIISKQNIATPGIKFKDNLKVNPNSEFLFKFNKGQISNNITVSPYIFNSDTEELICATWKKDNVISLNNDNTNIHFKIPSHVNNISIYILFDKPDFEASVEINSIELIELNKDKLVAYMVPVISGNLCRTSDLLGHKKYLNDGIMYLLFDYLINFLLKNLTDVKYLWYYTMSTTKNGLNTFKKNIGFKISDPDIKRPELLYNNFPSELLTNEKKISNLVKFNDLYATSFENKIYKRNEGNYIQFAVCIKDLTSGFYRLRINFNKKNYDNITSYIRYDKDYDRDYVLYFYENSLIIPIHLLKKYDNFLFYLYIPVDEIQILNYELYKCNCKALINYKNERIKFNKLNAETNKYNQKETNIPIKIKKYRNDNNLRIIKNKIEFIEKSNNPGFYTNLVKLNKDSYILKLNAKTDQIPKVIFYDSNDNKLNIDFELVKSNRQILILFNINQEIDLKLLFYFICIPNLSIEVSKLELFRKNINFNNNLFGIDQSNIIPRPFENLKLANIFNLSKENKNILIRGRIQFRRNLGNVLFLIINEFNEKIQCIIRRDNEIFNFIKKIPIGSLVILLGDLVKSKKQVNNVSNNVSNLELLISKCFILNKTETYQLNKNKLVNYNLRSLDIRQDKNKIIFKLVNSVVEYFKSYLLQNNFIQIFSPKIIEGASEGGSECFKLDYYGKMATLAQSPQLYKQILSANSDFARVFEIGPIFRAENSMTKRHLSQYTGLDLEMVIDNNYSEVIEMLSNLLIYIFENIEKNNKNEVNILKKFYNYEPIKYTNPITRLEYKDACKLLNENNITQDVVEDLSTYNEKMLGKLIKDKYNVDIFILDKYPKSVRPFYTKKCPKDTRFTNSYDIILRGTEILSGAQRIHSYQELCEALKEKNMELNEIQGYLSTFKYATYPHGGGGFGLERFIMTLFNIPSIKQCSLFPRDPVHLSP